jgi:long-subunit acyl-CoA synthetase (AMP-forming)
VTYFIRYIAAEKIENILVTAPLIAQIFVYGDSLKDVLVAVIVPDVEVIKQQAATWGSADLPTLCVSDAFRTVRRQVVGVRRRRRNLTTAGRVQRARREIDCRWPQVV